MTIHFAKKNTNDSAFLEFTGGQVKMKKKTST